METERVIVEGTVAAGHDMKGLSWMLKFLRIGQTGVLRIRNGWGKDPNQLVMEHVIIKTGDNAFTADVRKVE